MCYANLLFLYKNQLSSLIFNEITVFNFSTKLDYKTYLIEVLSLFIKDDQQFDTIKIINIVDIIDNVETEPIKYYIDINEQTEKIIYNAGPFQSDLCDDLDGNALDFHLVYNEFLQKYNLWNGKDYLYHFLLMKNKKSVKEQVKKRQETIKNNISLLYKLKKLYSKNKTKCEQYKLQIANQLVIQYKYNITNYKKINVDKIASPIIVTKLNDIETRISKNYSKQQYSITIMTNNNKSTINYKIIMVDDGHDYYSSSEYTPTVSYDINENSIFSKIYLTNLLKYLMNTFYDCDIDECECVDNIL
jgi:hypothetical protein